MKSLLRACAALAAAATLAAPATAARSYPDQPVTIVVPYAPGGVTDLYGRAIADYLGRIWKVPVMVKNEGGGGTMIGTEVVASAEPAGSTVLLTGYSYTFHPVRRKVMSYGKDAFRAVILVGQCRNILVV